MRIWNRCVGGRNFRRIEKQRKLNVQPRACEDDVLNSTYKRNYNKVYEVATFKEVLNNILEELHR